MRRATLCLVTSTLLIAWGMPTSQTRAFTSNDFSWTQAADCPLPRFEAMGLAVQGKLLVMGGFISSSLDVTPRVDVFDPETNTWAQRQDLPGPETHVGAAVKDGT